MPAPAKRRGYRSRDVLGGWRSREALLGQHRRGYSDRFCSRDLVVGHVVWVVKTGEELFFATAVRFV